MIIPISFCLSLSLSLFLSMETSDKQTQKKEKRKKKKKNSNTLYWRIPLSLEILSIFLSFTDCYYLYKT